MSSQVAGGYRAFYSISTSSLDGVLVHGRRGNFAVPSIKLVGAHSYIWVERSTVRVMCLAQEHNTLTQARARTQAARSEAHSADH